MSLGAARILARHGEVEDLVLISIVRADCAHVLPSQENFDVSALQLLVKIGQVVLDVLARHLDVVVLG